MEWKELIWFSQNLRFITPFITTSVAVTHLSLTRHRHIRTGFSFSRLRVHRHTLSTLSRSSSFISFSIVSREELISNWCCWGDAKIDWKIYVTLTCLHENQHWYDDIHQSNSPFIIRSLLSLGSNFSPSLACTALVLSTGIACTTLVLGTGITGTALGRLRFEQLGCFWGCLGCCFILSGLACLCRARSTSLFCFRVDSSVLGGLTMMGTWTPEAPRAMGVSKIRCHSTSR